MAELASTLTDTLLRRVRDPQGLAHSRTFARTCLSHAQRILNTTLGVVVQNVTFATTPQMQIYSVSGFVPTAARVIAVRENGRDLAKLSNHVQLAHYSLQWFREVGSRFEAWCPIGRDLIAIYPAKSLASSVEIRYAKLTTDLTAETTATEMPDEYMDYIVTMAECFLLAKQRDLKAAMVALTRLTEDFKDDMLPVRLHMAGVGEAVGAGTMRLPGGQGG